MNDRVLIAHCLQKVGKDVKLAGFVQTVRSHGKIAFFDLRDRSGIIQVVSSDTTISQIAQLNTEDVVSVEGMVKKREERYINKNSSTGTIELELQKISVIAKSQEMPFDMAGKELNLELPTLLDYRSLTLRHPTITPIFKIQAAIVDSFREVSKRLDCTEVFVPTIAPSSTEGGAEVFKIDYYSNKAFLAQSPQLYKQMMVPVFERVYTIAHAYRAEPSVTTRHLVEVTQLDNEFGFVTFEELLDLLEKVGKETLLGAQEKTKDIFEQEKLEPIVIGEKIPRLTLKETHELVYKLTGRDNRNEKDLTPQEEIDISEWAKKEQGSDLVTITHFPTKKRAFYTTPDPKDPSLSLSYDILFRGVEIASGSQRINDYQELIKAIEERGMDPKNFGMYLMAFKYSMPHEGGFSYGLERITQKIMGLLNIRQASLFPRDMERVDERFSLLDAQKDHPTTKQ